MVPWITLGSLLCADGGEEEDGALELGGAGAIGQFDFSVIVGPVGRSLLLLLF
jgi:hypothetical protein